MSSSIQQIKADRRVYVDPSSPQIQGVCAWVVNECNKSGNSSIKFVKASKAEALYVNAGVNYYIDMEVSIGSLLHNCFAQVYVNGSSIRLDEFKPLLGLDLSIGILKPLLGVDLSIGILKPLLGVDASIGIL
ncbi:hypothetical protein BVRB_1g018100 [Beta vulgaris subsp. vulgaris]|uniref:uncharacterized protein LOC104905301 n=1 Tax=Beta vulgaris subsp. vulgaris TaxID=3555 RepID=UPI0005401D69|nr:uncharacterized protein LOC104905301 [Beta vulgaris subsp. vulgaris]KMS99968.1 hypothetical protein BVRB_1g018100 [Beta vulgaris subsp. vulgaris]